MRGSARLTPMAAQRPSQSLRDVITHKRQPWCYCSVGRIGGALGSLCIAYATAGLCPMKMRRACHDTAGPVDWYVHTWSGESCVWVVWEHGLAAMEESSTVWQVWSSHISTRPPREPSGSTIEWNGCRCPPAPFRTTGSSRAIFRRAECTSAPRSLLPHPL